MDQRAHSVPSVTVAMPVYNGGPWLAEALDCWLAQDYRDFEFLISDNASSDDTPRILEKYAALDPRIRVSRRAQTVPPEENFNGLAREARAPLLVYAACDDLWEPSFLRRMRDTLEANPDAVAAYCVPRYFGNRGPLRGHHPLGDVPAGCEGTSLGRAIAVLRASNWLPIYGLLRTAALRRTRGLYQPMGIAPDVGVALQLAVLGRLLAVNEPLMAVRLHQAAYSQVQRGRRFDEGARSFVEGLPFATATERRIFMREAKLYCRKGGKPRYGIWRVHAFRYAWVRGGRALVDAERWLLRTG